MHATGHLARSFTSSNRFLTVCCVTVVPTAEQISAADTAVQCTTAIRRIWQPSFSVVVHGHLEPGLLDVVPSSDHCCQQSCTVDTFLPRLSEYCEKKIHLLVALLHDLVQT